MDDQLPSLIIIFTTFQERLRRTKTRSNGDCSSQQDLPSSPTRRWMDTMSLVFVVFMDIHYCFCFHGCAHASIHNVNQVLANIGKEPTKKEVRREFCLKTKKCEKNGRFEIKVIVRLRQLDFQLSQGLDQIAQAAKCLNRFSSSLLAQDSKQGSLKAPGRKKTFFSQIRTKHKG